MIGLRVGRRLVRSRQNRTFRLLIAERRIPLELELLPALKGRLRHRAIPVRTSRALFLSLPVRLLPRMSYAEILHTLNCLAALKS